MSMQDYMTFFCGSQAITSGTTYSSHIIDLGTQEDAWGNAIDPRPGQGGRLVLNVRAVEKFSGLSAGASQATLTLALMTGDASTAQSTALLTAQALSFGVADMDAGDSLWDVRLPATIKERYIKLRFAVTGADFGDGAIDAWLGLENESPH